MTTQEKEPKVREGTKNKLSRDERRSLVIEALQSEANRAEIARRYGIRRESLYDILSRAVLDPKGRVQEAEKELAFRKKVKDLVG